MQTTSLQIPKIKNIENSDYVVTDDVDGQSRTYYRWIPVIEMEKWFTTTILEKFKNDVRVVKRVGQYNWILEKLIWVLDEIYDYFDIYNAENNNLIIKFFYAGFRHLICNVIKHSSYLVNNIKKAVEKVLNPETTNYKNIKYIPYYKEFYGVDDQLFEIYHNYIDAKNNLFYLSINITLSPTQKFKFRFKVNDAKEIIGKFYENIIKNGNRCNLAKICEIHPKTNRLLSNPSSIIKKKTKKMKNGKRLSKSTKQVTTEVYSITNK
jgi:hypothetical protein